MHQKEDACPSYFPWKISLIMVMSPQSLLRFQPQRKWACGCVTRSIGNRNTMNIIASIKKKEELWAPLCKAARYSVNIQKCSDTCTGNNWKMILVLGSVISNSLCQIRFVCLLHKTRRKWRWSVYFLVSKSSRINWIGWFPVSLKTTHIYNCSTYHRQS